MEFIANEGKKVEIKVGEDIYLRHCIKTKFINQGESYIEILKNMYYQFMKKGTLFLVAKRSLPYVKIGL